LPDVLAQGQQKRELMLIISGVLLQTSNTIMSRSMVPRLRNKPYINQKDNGFTSARALYRASLLATARGIDPTTGFSELV
jgi:hypothetical protein